MFTSAYGQRLLCSWPRRSNLIGRFIWKICSRPRMGPWFQHIRDESSTSLAMGELFVNQNEWLPLVANRWIDFIRIHISAAGGLSLARKAAI